MTHPAYDSVAQMAHDLERCKRLILRLDSFARVLDKTASRDEALLTVSVIIGEIRAYIREDLGGDITDAHHLPYVVEAQS